MADSLQHPNLDNEILNYANQTDEEICGFILNNKQFIQLENKASDKKNNFSIDDLEFTKYNNITAIVHSHTKDFPFLSEADFIVQQNTAIDFWLACGKKVYKYRYMQPLIGREFKHGTTDCYTLFRDIYHLCDIEMPNFKRHDDWWIDDNLYLKNMPPTGFYQVYDVQAGDIILINLGAKVPNHAMIYIGNNQVIHHYPKRLSKRDLYDGYWLKHTHSIWRHKAWRSLNFMAVLNNMAISTR